MSRHTYLFAVVIIALASCFAASAVTAQTFSDMGAGLIGAKFATSIWGDYNGDGYLDLLVMGQNTSNVPTTRLYTNNAGASFSNAGAGFANVNAGPNAAAWGDFDRDGDLDLALTGSTGSSAVCNIYRNNGNGTFSDIGAGLTGVMFSAVAWGDFDGDGDLDLAVAGRTAAGAQITRVYRNNAGTFVDIGAGLPGLEYANIAWVDYDNDGDMDLMVTGSTGTSSLTRLYRNDAGSFVNSGIVFPAMQNASIAWGDYDNDGDMDLALSGYYAASATYYARIYRNDGGGTFTFRGDLPRKLAWGCLAWGDYDNDGDLDLAATGLDSSLLGYTIVYRNDDGTFVDSSAGLPGAQSSTVAWGDLDNDGRLDLAVAGISGTTAFARIYRNTGGPANTLPSAPTTFNSVYDGGGDVELSWGEGTDAETPATGLYYNIAVATAAGAIVVPPQSLASGFRLIPGAGNRQTTKTLRLDGLADGVYLWAVQSIDGNWAGSPPSAYQTFTVDFTPPTGTIVINNGDAVTGSTTVDLTLSATDNAYEVSSMRFSNDNATWSEWETYATAKSGWVMASGDGTQTVYVQFRDNWGNASDSFSDTITLDQTGPTATVAIKNGDPYTNTTAVNLTLDATDALSPVAEMRFSNDNATWSAWVAYGTSRAWIIDNIPGTRTVYAQFKDSLGNASGSFSDTIILDKTIPNPRSAVINAGAAQTNSADVTLTLTAGDPLSGVPLMRFRNETNGVFSVWEPYATSKAWTILGVDGVRRVYVQFQDGAGNIATVSDTIILDTVSPTATISAPSAALTGVDPVSYTVTYTDVNGIGGVGLSAADVTLNKTGNADGTIAVTGSGDTRTVTIENISGRGTLGISIAAGSATDVAGNAALPAGPSATFVVKAPPLNVSITPNSGGIAFDTKGTYTVVVSDPNGATNIKEVQFLINDSASTANAVVVKYLAVGSNTLWVSNDAGTSWTGGRAVGSGFVLENSQCKLYCADTSYSTSGNDLTINFVLEVKSSMSGKNLSGYLFSYDVEMNYDSWVPALANFYTNEAPSNVSLSPNAGTQPIGTQLTFTSVFRDPNGWANIDLCYLVINETLSNVDGISLFYHVATNKVYLRNDQNTSWGTGYVPGTAVELENSQCKVDVENITVTTSGTDMTIDWKVEIKPSMSGALLSAWMYVRDILLLKDGYDVMGSYYSPVAPENISVSPNSGSVATGVPQTFTVVQRDANGYTDIQRSWLLISTGSSVNAVYLWYYAPTGAAYLRNDANNSWGAPAVLGSATVLENSQCKVYMAGSSVSGSGNDLTLNWQIELKPSMSGKTLKQMLKAQDGSALTDGFDLAGTFTTP